MKQIAIFTMMLLSFPYAAQAQTRCFQTPNGFRCVDVAPQPIVPQPYQQNVNPFPGNQIPESNAYPYPTQPQPYSPPQYPAQTQCWQTPNGMRCVNR